MILHDCKPGSDCELCPDGMLEMARYRILNPQRYQNHVNELRICRDCMAKLAGEWLARFITFPPPEV